MEKLVVAHYTTVNFQPPLRLGFPKLEITRGLDFSDEKYSAGFTRLLEP